MKVQFHIRGFKDNAELRDWLQQPLARLDTQIPISAAAVVVEHERHNAPAFRAYALLAVPGPDLHAEARDHTLQAVWLKVTVALIKQIEMRRTRQISRAKTNRQVRAPVSRAKRSAVGKARG